MTRERTEFMDIKIKSASEGEILSIELGYPNVRLVSFVNSSEDIMSFKVLMMNIYFQNLSEI